jgi:hypothetical protein
VLVGTKTPELTASGGAELAGKVVASTESGYNPELGTKVQIVKGEVSSEFDEVEDVEPPSGRAYAQELKAGEALLLRVVEGRTATTVTTSLSGAGKSGTSITVPEGSKVQDQATIEGENAGSAGGEIVYDVYSNSRCTVLLRSAGGGSVSGGKAPASTSVVLTPGSTYFWEAEYSGDSKNLPSHSGCTEMVTVNKRTETKVATSLSGAGQSGSSITVPEGSEVQDQATLSGANAGSAGGTIVYRVFADSSCSLLVKEAGGGTVSAGKAPASSKVVLASGTYHWQAEYKGDVNNLPASSGCGEMLTVAAPPPPKVELAPPPSSISLGGGAAITAIVTERGEPVGGRAVTFTVTGANPQSAVIDTGSDGRSTFSYTGTHAGADHILGSFVDGSGHSQISNEVTIVWNGATSSGSGTGPQGGVHVLGETTHHNPLPPPVLGRTVNVAPVSGTVFVKLPPGTASGFGVSTSLNNAAGFPPLRRAFFNLPPDTVIGLAVSASLHKGVGFIPLTEARQIPVGSILDTGEGVVKLTSATSATANTIQFGDFTAGLFKVLQERKARALTELDIMNVGSLRSVCASVGKKAVAARRGLNHKVLGRLHGEAHGRFTTRGEFSSATVRGTIWSVTNRCDGTLTAVARGVVSVRDFARRRTISLRAGHSYLARRP